MLQKKTAVQWLIDKMLDSGIGICKEWREQAKDMFIGQICLAHLEGQHQDKKLPSQYYIDTYGSKENSELSKVAENTSFDNPPKEVKKEGFGKIKFTEEEWAKLNNGISQTEISDEDINKEAKRLYDNSDKEYYAFFMGAMFYREQLKKKQNG